MIFNVLTTKTIIENVVCCKKKMLFKSLMRDQFTLYEFMLFVDSEPKRYMKAFD